MSDALRNEVLKLPTAARLALLGELWDSIPDKDLSLTAEQREDLEQRLAEANADPNGGTPWEDARTRIRTRRR